MVLVRGIRVRHEPVVVVVGGLKGYNSLMFLLAIPIIPRTKTTTTTSHPHTPAHGGP